MQRKTPLLGTCVSEDEEKFSWVEDDTESKLIDVMENVWSGENYIVENSIEGDFATVGSNRSMGLLTGAPFGTHRLGSSQELISLTFCEQTVNVPLWTSSRAGYRSALCQAKTELPPTVEVIFRFSCVIW